MSLAALKFSLTLLAEHISVNETEVKVKVAQSCLTVAHQVPLSMELSRQEYWSRWPFPSPGESSQPRGRTQVSHIAGRFFTI